MSIIPIRIYFQKKGRLKYISHLDTMTVFTRAVTRSKIPVWYTEGFNPRIYISFPMPLSLGYEGRREVFDLRLIEDLSGEEVRDAINSVLPEDLAVIDVIRPKQSIEAIAWADYEIELYYPQKGKEAEQSFNEYIEQDKILVEKKEKKRTQIIDILPYVKIKDIRSTEDTLTFQARMAAGIQFNINPRLFCDGFAVAFGTKPEGVMTVREQLLDGMENEFT